MKQKKEPIRKRRVVLKDESVLEIIKLYKKGYSRTTLAEKFYVTYGTINNVLNGRTHSNVTGIVYKKKYKVKNIQETVNNTIKQINKTVSKNIKVKEPETKIKDQNINLNFNIKVNGKEIDPKDINGLIKLLKIK